MLDFLRGNLKRFAILFWIAAFAFIIGGAYLFVRGPFTMGSNTAIEVGNIKISFPEYERAYNDMYKFYVQLLTQLKGGNITDEDIKKLNIRQKTINMLVDRALLLQEAQREGIRVTKEDVVRSIESNRTFYSDGRFSKEKYLALLRANNVNPKDYEESLKISLYIEKLKSKLFRNIKITDKQIREFFSKNYSRVDVAFITVDPKKFQGSIEPTVDKLREFYTMHKESYRIPTRVKIKYIVVPLSYVKKEIKVSDNETKNFYRNHITYFEVPLRIRVAHILFAKKDNQTDTQVKEEAEKVYDMLKDKKITFKEAVKRYSDDPYTKNVGGDLGYVTENMVVKKFWDNIVDLKPHEISKPFKTKFGYHIVMVEDVKKPFRRPFNKVKGEIVDYIKTMRAKKVWFVEADKIFVKIRNSKESMGKIAKRYGLEVKESDYISLKKPESPFTSQMVQNALLSSKGKLLGPDLSSDGYLIYKVIDEKASYIPQFEQVKDKVEDNYVKYKSEQLAKQRAKEFLNLLKKGRKLGSIAKKYGLKINKVINMYKLVPDEKFPCSSNEGTINSIFDNGKGYVDICQQDGKFYVFKVLNKKVDEEEFKKLRNSIKQQLLTQEENEDLNDLLARLKKQTKIKINPKL